MKGKMSSKRANLAASFRNPKVEASNLDPTRIREFIDQLAALNVIRIRLPVIHKLFADVFSPRPREIELRRWLLTALEQAADEGVIRLPSRHGKCWERLPHPPIPSYVDRVVAPKPSHRPWKTFRWHPKLAWIGDLPHLTSKNEEFLRRVHQRLVNDEFTQLAPLKRRSLELTGDEKRLGKLARTKLFGEKRLTLELLGCVPDYPQLAMEKVGDRPTVVVFENIGSFRVAYEVLRQMSRPPYGFVAYGAGMSFTRSIATLTNHSIERIDYVGDLDIPGLKIVRTARRLADELGLPSPLPAPGIHRMMIDLAGQLGHPLGFPYKKAGLSKPDELLVNWLPQEAQVDVHRILTTGNRIPEEILAEKDMAALW